MKLYNVYGYALILAYALGCMYFAPAQGDPKGLMFITYVIRKV